MAPRGVDDSRVTARGTLATRAASGVVVTALAAPGRRGVGGGPVRWLRERYASMSEYDRRGLPMLALILALEACTGVLWLCGWFE